MVATFGLTRPGLLVRLEGGAMFLAAVAFYWAIAGPWWAFAAAFLLPDLAILAYLGNPRTGAIVYNLVHTLLGPLALVVIAAALAAREPGLVALVWIAHIGLDRLLGFGLKYPEGFKPTHLGRI
ncbi:MAG TPA: DUF4260 domain-containing protein [Gemmatimonadales bacterium]|nr:DUF4260 domain-containing protein [Gemmatimonadales bacterium]